MPEISVVVPVYNERPTIERVLQRIQAVEVDKEVIVVDDGSTDGTRELLEDLGEAIAERAEQWTAPSLQQSLEISDFRVFFLPENRGKGAALQRAFSEAQGEIVLIQDADLEYDPKDWNRLLAPIRDGSADVVYGSRFKGGGPRRVLLFWHEVGNRILTTFQNMFTNLNLSDVWTCYKVFRKEVVDGMELREPGFGFEPEFTAKMAKEEWRVYEVAISYRGRSYEEGKKIGWKDGLRGVWCILRYGLFG